MVDVLIRACCVCQKTEHKGKWDKHNHHEEKKRDKTGIFTHGFCPPCFKEEAKSLKEKYNIDVEKELESLDT